MQIIAIANQKGGVAKTTTTHNLGVALSAKGKRVLLIDLDSQASLTISAGLEPLEVEKNIVSVLKKDGEPIGECIQKVKENLDIVTSIIDLAPMEMEMLSRASREKILDRALKSVRVEYNYILIDCPPQLSILTINALSCADGVIIPVKTDYLAYRGLTQLQNSINEIQELINPNLSILGVIATLYEMRVNDDTEILEALKEEVQPAAKDRPKADREIKKRVSLSVFPSSYEDLQKIAFVNRQSVSDIITELIAQYVANNAGALKEYEEIKK